MTRSLLCMLAIATALAAPGRAETAFGELQERIIEIADRVKPSVVHIEAIVKINDRRSEVTGSGLIASADGHILTNHHVVDKAEKVEVVVPGRRHKFPATVVGTDKQTDIALLRIQSADPLPAATFGSASEVRVGQWVLAIGNPYGLDGSVSFGIVSAKGRNLEIEDVLNDFIQTDAMIDRGSSGGPLVDLDGRVIGINSRGQGRGIGFTIPIDTALDVMRQLDQGGIERGWLGITIQPLDRDLAAYFGAPEATGVVVNSVTARSPAERAGLKPGDIVTRFSDQPVEAEKEEDLGSFQRLVANLRPGDEAEVGVLRDGRERRHQVRIGAQPKVESAEAESDVGFHVQEITENLYRDQRLATRRGAFVHFVARGTPAAEAGLMPGDVVARIEDVKVEDLGDFARAIESVRERPLFLITARRGAETKFLLVKRGARPAAPAEPEGNLDHASHEAP